MNTPQSLPRVIGPIMATAIVVGTVIGSGVFKKGRNVAEACPEFGLAISVWILGGFLALLGALTIAEVAVRIPKAGGNYAFLREGYGRWAGFLWGWVDFGIIRTSSIGVLAVMVVESLNDILTQTAEIRLLPWTRAGLSVAVIGLLTAINIRGTKLGGNVQIVLTTLKVGSLLAIIALPLILLVVGSRTDTVPTTAYFSPWWPSDWSKVEWVKFGAAVVAVQWAYHGWLNITPVAEEVTNPQRNIPLALLSGIAILIFLYVGAQVSYYTTLPREQLMLPGTVLPQNSGLVISELTPPQQNEMKQTPVSTAFFVRLLGNVGGIIASLILMTSVLGSLNGNILVAPRLLYAMCDDGLAPKRLRDLHQRYNTPALAMLVFSGWAMTLVIACELTKTVGLVRPERQVFDMLTEYCVFGATIFETMGVAAIFVLRRKQANITPTLPYLCPGYPVVPIVYVLLLAAILYTMLAGENWREACVGLIYIAIGVGVYFGLLRRSSPRG